MKISLGAIKMPHEILIKLEESIYKKLPEKIKKDPDKLSKFVAKAIEEELKKSNSSVFDTGDLSNFLNKAKQGSRNFGAKGQGW